MENQRRVPGDLHVSEPDQLPGTRRCQRMRRKGGAPLPKGQRKDILMRLIKTVFSFYPVMLPIALLLHPVQRHHQFHPLRVHAEYHCPGGTELENRRLGLCGGADWPFDRHPGGAVCAQPGGRRHVQPVDGHHHPGLPGENAQKNVQPYAGPAHPLFRLPTTTAT